MSEAATSCSESEKDTASQNDESPDATSLMDNEPRPDDVHAVSCLKMLWRVMDPANALRAVNMITDKFKHLRELVAHLREVVREKSILCHKVVRDVNLADLLTKQNNGPALRIMKLTVNLQVRMKEVTVLEVMTLMMLRQITPKIVATCPRTRMVRLVTMTRTHAMEQKLYRTVRRSTSFCVVLVCD